MQANQHTPLEKVQGNWCFYNPGLDEINNSLTTEEIAGYFKSRASGDYLDMIDFLQRMRGATRVSVGIATTQSDLEAFISFVDGLRPAHFIDSPRTLKYFVPNTFGFINANNSPQRQTDLCLVNYPKR